MDKRGAFFVVSEGIDGSGKSTQFSLGENYAFELSKHHHTFKTREPFKDEEIRKRLEAAADSKKDAEWYLKAFVDDRRKHAKRLEMELAQGFHCFSDRYDLSTYFYQSLQGISFDRIKQAHEGILMPDLYLVYDCPAEVAFERRKKGGATTVFDKDLELQKKLAALYHQAKELFPEKNIVVIDADRSIEAVFEDTKKALDALFKK